MKNQLRKTDFVILCGGLGTRLRPVLSDRPKVMADVHGKPFLEIVVRELLNQGFRRIIFCTGYLGDHIENYFRGRRYPERPEFEFSREEKPLGTGGAVKRALPLVRSDHFLVMNGDCFPEMDFGDFYTYHREKQSPLSIAVAKGSGGTEYGSVFLDEVGRIASFKEKGEAEKGGFVSAGCYLIHRSAVSFFPESESFSIEYDVFPRSVGKSYGFVFDGTFLDIGTPERYASAGDFFS